MPAFIYEKGHTQIIVPLRISPHKHRKVSTITGSVFSNEAGTVLYGYYNMEYLLPDGDRIRLIANHNRKTVQLLLFTHSPHLLRLLPGNRPSSLVADVISKVNRYSIRSLSYRHPLSKEQRQKAVVADECVAELQKLLSFERQLSQHDHRGHEGLRRQVITIIEHSRDKNRSIANNPVVSEGELGHLLYEAHKTAQHYQFNRVYAVSHHDQMDFSQTTTNRTNKEPPCFVWDSEEHIGHDSVDLDDALRIICQYYHLSPAAELHDIPANRFEKLEFFARQLLRDGQDWIRYLAIKEKPTHQTQVIDRNDGVSITKISPYYQLQGIQQKGYNTLEELINCLTESQIEPLKYTSLDAARRGLASQPNGSWANLNERQSVVRLNNKLIILNHFTRDGLYYPLPDGSDLYTLSQLSKRHLYLPERISLRLKGFISRVPTFFQSFYQSISQFISHDLHEEFFNHVHADHKNSKEEAPSREASIDHHKIKCSLHEALKNGGYLTNGQTLEEFIKEQIDKSPYVIARANHPPSHHHYDNPLHRAFSVFRHFASYFIDTSERDPIFGTLAIGAYFYGGGAILAPEVLKSVLTKLHLSGLIAGIEPTQKFARWMNHGSISEAITASAFYWQGAAISGNLDNFFVEAVTVLKDDPAELAIIAALALSLGFGLTKAIPALQREMGEFPYANYAALGGKGGAAIYDTIMHPGDDWLLGTTKWFFKTCINVSKLIIAPFIEAYHYGYSKGFINGWKKSSVLGLCLSKQFLAALLDFSLALITIPLIEVSTLVLHVPFRGITNLVRKTAATLGNISAIGTLLLEIAQRPSVSNFLSEFKISPLYGFSSPFSQFSHNPLANLCLNCISALLFIPWQIAKNFLILPFIDIASLLIRASLSIINPASRVLAYSAGMLLLNVGFVWDRSFGILFSLIATTTTICCDWLDNRASDVKQLLLSLIAIGRGELYAWAFYEEDLQSHTETDDTEYYFNDPRRCELVPHADSHCLLNVLLPEANKTSHLAPNRAVTGYNPRLFKESTKGLNSSPELSPRLQM